MAIKVSQSRVKTWIKCKQMHYYKYVEKLQPTKKSRPLTFGTLIHDLQEVHAEGKDYREKLMEIEDDQGAMFRIQREELGNIVSTAEVIFQAYLDYYSDHPLKFVKYKGKRSEHELEVEIAPGIILVMKIDGFIKTDNSLRWLLEHKTFKSLPSDDDRWRNFQIAVYFKGCEILGMKPFDGVCWNYIRSKEPSRPLIKKDETMSTKACDTLPAVVKQVAEENGITDYQVQLEAAEERLPKWFQRIFTPVSPRVVDLVFEDFIIASQEIVEHGKYRCEKNIDRHCSWCSYESICRAELTGGDPEYVKEQEYERRKKRKKVQSRSSRN